MKQGDRIQNGHQYGFFMIPNEMIDSHIENMGALGFVVYSVLMRHANSSSQCFPSYSTLEKKSSLSRPTIAKCIDNLVSKGYIQKLDIGNSRGHATTYQLLDLSLVPTSKGDLPVNEVNQSMSLTSKGGLLVTSKGGLPQLVNEVNSNNTNLTKPINNNTHIKESDFFEISLPEETIENLALENKSEDRKTPPPPTPAAPIAQNSSKAIAVSKQAERYQQFEARFSQGKSFNRHVPKAFIDAGYGEWHNGTHPLDWRQSLIDVCIQRKKKRGDESTVGAATDFISNVIGECIELGMWTKFQNLVNKALELEAIEQSKARSPQTTPQPIELVASPPPAHLRERFRVS